MSLSLPRIQKAQKKSQREREKEKEKTGSEEEEELIAHYKNVNKSFNLYSIIGSTPNAKNNLSLSTANRKEAASPRKPASKPEDYAPNSINNTS